MTGALFPVCAMICFVAMYLVLLFAAHFFVSTNCSISAGGILQPSFWISVCLPFLGVAATLQIWLEGCSFNAKRLFQQQMSVTYKN